MKTTATITIAIKLEGEKTARVYEPADYEEALIPLTWEGKRVEVIKIQVGDNLSYIDCNKLRKKLEEQSKNFSEESTKVQFDENWGAKITSPTGESYWYDHKEEKWKLAEKIPAPLAA